MRLAEFVELYRIPYEYGEALMADHLALARTLVVQQLGGFRTQQEAAGHATLAAVPLHGFAGEAERFFKRAVHCLAKAFLLAQFATTVRHTMGKEEGKEPLENYRQFEAWSQNAVSVLLDTTSIMVEAL